MKDNLPYIQSLFSFYQSNRNKDLTLKNQVLMNVKSISSGPDFLTVCAVVFQSDRYICNQIHLLITESLATNTYKDFDKYPEEIKEPLLNLFSNLAIRDCQEENYSLNEDKVNIWKTVFKDEAFFNKLLTEKIDDLKVKALKEEKYKKELLKKAVDKVVMKVPVLVYVEEKLSNNEAPSILTSEFSKYFKDFNFQIHFNQKENSLALVGSSLSFENGNWIFEFSLTNTKELSNIESLKNYLVKELSSGWGDVVGQNQLLVGDKIYNLSFDVDNLLVV